MINSQRQAKKPNCFLPVQLSIDGITQGDIVHVTEARQRSDNAKPGVQLEGTMGELDRFSQPFAGQRVRLLHGSEITIIGRAVLWSPPLRYCDFGLKQFWLN